MTGLLFCLSAAAMGVDYGWQPVAGGGIEYIIQIEPDLLDSLRAGRDVFSDLPSSVSNIRRYRITVGNSRLPHHGEPPPAPAVVQAGGEMHTDAGSNDRSRRRRSPAAEDPADIDMSQLPGPVLAPALVLDGPPKAKETDEKHAADEMASDEIANEKEEPQRFAASTSAAPLGSRMASFHQHEQESAEKSAAEKSSHRKKGEPEGVESTTKQKASKETAAHTEPESPSDDRAAAADPSQAKKSLLTQIGLITSVCCNVFLLWVATGQRSRYRALVRRMFEGNSIPLIDRDADLPRWERLPAPANQGASGAPSGEDAQTS